MVILFVCPVYLILVILKRNDFMRIHIYYLLDEGKFYKSYDSDVYSVAEAVNDFITLYAPIDNDFDKLVIEFVG